MLFRSIFCIQRENLLLFSQVVISMKKLLSIILLFLFSFNFFIAPAMAKEVECLYAVKNAKSSQVKGIADFYSRQNNMPIVNSKSDYSFVRISSLENDYYYYSVEQVNEDTYFYYYSCADNEKIKPDILKRFKINGLKYSKISSKPAIAPKRQAAEKVIAENSENRTPTLNASNQNAQKQDSLKQDSQKQNTTYDFSDAAQERYNAVRSTTSKTAIHQTPQVQRADKKTMANSIRTTQPVQVVQPNNYNNQMYYANQTVRQAQPVQVIQPNNYNNQAYYANQGVRQNQPVQVVQPNGYNNQVYRAIPTVRQNQQNADVWGQSANSATTKYASVSNSPLPAGLSFSIIMQSDISTSSLEQNDRISALLQNDLYVNNRVVAKQGSIVYGTAAKSARAGRAYGDASAALVFDKILTTDGEEITFRSESFEYRNEKSHRGAKIAGTMFAAVMSGVAAAALSGAIRDTDDWGRTLGVGAAVGAVGGTVTVLMATGEEVELKQGTVLTIKTIR